ncbi:hypothetical protein Nmel_008373, partial [Mimus melanotis]
GAGRRSRGWSRRCPAPPAVRARCRHGVRAALPVAEGAGPWPRPWCAPRCALSASARSRRPAPPSRWSVPRAGSGRDPGTAAPRVRELRHGPLRARAVRRPLATAGRAQGRGRAAPPGCACSAGQRQAGIAGGGDLSGAAAAGRLQGG